MDEIRNPDISLNPSMYIHIMEQLLHVVQKLSAARDLNTVMDIVRHSVRDLTGSDGSTFVLRDNDFCYYAEEDAVSPLWKGRRFPLQTCVSGWTILNKRPAIIGDVYADPRISMDIYENTFVKSLVMVPIRTEEPIGAIGSYWSVRHIPTPEQIKVMQVLADTAAIAMDNIHSQSIIAIKARQLEEAMDSTMFAVAKMVEQRDLYTSGHQKRVATIGLAIAEELGWPEERCEGVFRAGIVHDIGKIGIPSELLSKPAKLTPFEFALIKTHAEAGYEILKDVPLLLPIAQIILQHHERINGSGYPYGLRADEILPEAKILGVADVFESMISHRPYRPALGVDAAIEELVTNRGILYAPDVVDAMVNLVRNKGFQVPK